LRFARGLRAGGFLGLELMRAGRR